MAKKTAERRTSSQRIDPADYGVDLFAIIQEIEPHLEGLRREIGERAGNMPENNVNRLLRGHLKPSLGAVAALAHASGGRLVVKYEPPTSARKRGKKSKD